MADISVIVRRVLRHRIKTGEGLEGVVGDLLGDDWQSMLSANRQHRDGIATQIAKQIKNSLANSSFMESEVCAADTSIDHHLPTVVETAG